MPNISHFRTKVGNDRNPVVENKENRVPIEIEGESVRVSDDDTVKPGKTTWDRPWDDPTEHSFGLENVSYLHPNFADIVRSVHPRKPGKKGVRSDS